MSFSGNKRRAMRYPWDAIVWWEIRRIPYNIIIFAAGLISVVIIEVIGDWVVKPGEDAVEPLAVLFGAIGYCVLANLGYTLGWITELLWASGDTEKTQATRPNVFRAGLVFSIGLTVLPALLIPLAWAILGLRNNAP
jgi:hypothetical protein